MFFVIIHLHINTMALPSRDVLSLFRRDNIQVRSPSSSIIVIVWDKCVGTEWLSCLLYAHVSQVIYRLQTSKAKVCHRTQTLFPASPVILRFVNRPTSTLLLSTMKKSCQSQSPFGENDAGSQATFDLHKEDEEVRLREGARWCSPLIVMTHAGPQRGTNIFNASNFCAAATILGTADGFFCGFAWDKSPADWKLPDLNLITFIMKVHTHACALWWGRSQELPEGFIASYSIFIFALDYVH